MDRLHALTLICLLAGCDQKPAAPVSVRSRVEAVAAKAPAGDPLADFCDVLPGRGAPVTLPAANPAASLGEGPAWVNVWATWCKPCLEEMPRLVRWQQQWAKDGQPVQLVFVSTDTDDQVLADFRRAHPGLPPSSRMSDPTSLIPWLEGLGLDPGAGLPVHVFVRDGAARCVRSGAVSDGHHQLVTELLGG